MRGRTCNHLAGNQWEDQFSSGIEKAEKLSRVFHGFRKVPEGLWQTWAIVESLLIAIAIVLGDLLAIVLRGS